MAYEKHRAAVDAGGGIWWSVSAARGDVSSQTLSLAMVDWSDEALIANFALRPGLPSIATAQVTLSTPKLKTWAQGFADAGIFEPLISQIIPAGEEMTDSVLFSDLTITFGERFADNVPLNTEEPGEPQNLYLEIVRQDGTGSVFVYGDLPLKETIL